MYNKAGEQAQAEMEVANICAQLHCFHSCVKIDYYNNEKFSSLFFVKFHQNEKENEHQLNITSMKKKTNIN